MEEDNDNRYAAFRFEESAAKNASMIGLSYRGFTYNDIIIKIRMRIRDYGGSASFQFRMPYFDEAKNKTVENIIGLLTVDKGKVCFLGEMCIRDSHGSYRPAIRDSPSGARFRKRSLSPPAFCRRSQWCLFRGSPHCGSCNLLHGPTRLS